MGTTEQVTFTDEELLLLGAEHPVVDMPYLGTLDARGRQVAVQVAHRSLCCHGAVPVDHGPGVEVPESIVTLLRARTTAEAILIVGRATPTEGVLRYHHLGPHEVVVEDVTDAGTHTFRWIDRSEVAAELSDFCATGGAVAGCGDPLTVTEAEFVAGEPADRLWGDGIVQFHATVWRPGPSLEDDESGASVAGAAVVFVLGSRGSWQGRRGGTPQVPNIDLQPIEPSTVAATILRELLPDTQPVESADEWPLMRA